MSQLPALPEFLWLLYQRLRRRGFAIGPEDYAALQDSLGLGFGWASQEALRELCGSLWAKSQREQEALFALFDQLVPREEAWELEREQARVDGGEVNQGASLLESDEVEPESERETKPKLEAQRGLPPISLEGVEIPKRSFVFLPQYPLSYREVAQAWRRLRRAVRTGPATELDVDGTIERRCRAGVASPLVFRPRRRNVAKLLLLVDRQGSMSLFHGFCDELVDAMRHAGRLENTALFYFHNAPAEGADEAVLDGLEGQLFPELDPVLEQIVPLGTGPGEGDVYDDGELLSLRSLRAVLDEHGQDASVVVISDGGAARGQYRVSRLLDTLAFFKALRGYTTDYVWLNPLPQRAWAGSTAGKIARHVPMFPMNWEGMHRAVNVLRGQHIDVERPL